MGKIKVARVPDITHDEWLALRRTGIGGSDAPTIVGLNPYSSRLYLYADKMGEIPAKEDNEAMRVGRDLEQYVAERWMEATGKRCQRNNFMWRSEENPFMLADIDREVIGENAALECKTTSAYSKYDFENGEIPLNYYCQMQHYMAVMGYERCYLGVLVLGRGFYHFCVERSEAEIAALVEAERQFYNNHMLTGIAPDADGSDASDTAIRKMFPASDVADAPAELTERSLSMLRTIDDLDTQIKELTTAKKAAQALVEQELGKCAYGSIGEYSVSWKPQSRTTIDSRRLKKEQPDIWEAYSKTSESRVFKVKKTEEE